MTDWSDWSREQWNQALFDHYFVLRHGEDAAVTRVAMSEEDLRAVVGDPLATGDELRDGFLKALRCRSPRELTERLSSAHYPDWSLAPQFDEKRPGYFVYLALTCLVAAGGGGRAMKDADFRRRLNSLMQLPEEPRQPLEDLPVLWKRLVRWLDDRRADGLPYRELVLPKEDWRRLIGFSIKLAFPQKEDQPKLLNVLQLGGVGKDPSPRETLRLIEKHSHKFSIDFREAFAELWELLVSSDSGFDTHPLWSAIRDAAANLESVGEAKARNKFKLLLLEDEELNPQILVIATRADDLPRGLEAVDTNAIGDEYRFVIAARSQDAPSSQRAADLLLQGALSEIPGIRATSIQVAVQQGLMLFERGDTGYFEHAASLPKDGDARALVNESLLEPFVSLFASTRRPRATRLRATDWYDLGLFNVAHLRLAAGLPPTLAQIRSLEPRSFGRRLQVEGGARLGGAYLGVPGALPRVWIDDADSVVVLRLARVGGVWRTFELLQLQLQNDAWVFPPDLQEMPEGQFVLVAMKQGRAIARRDITFRARSIGDIYLPPEPLSDWLVESGVGDLLPADEPPPLDSISAGRLQRPASRADDGKTRLDVSVPPVQPASLNAASRSVVPDDVPAVDAFTELLAVRATSRKGIPESELLEHLENVLQLDDWQDRWDVLRAWTEAGYFDCLSKVRWRERVYFVRPPRMIIRSSDREAVLGTMTGLAPARTRNALRQSAERAGGFLDLGSGASDDVPVPLRWRFPSREAAERCASEAGASVDHYEVERACADFVLSLPELRSFLEPPIGYQLTRRWDWHRGQFRDNQPNVAIRAESNGVAIDCYTRIDRADQFRVTLSGRPRFQTSSRNWSLLVAHALAGESPYATSERDVLVRRVSAQVYLPLPVGRWLSAVTGNVSGPTTGVSTRTFAYLAGSPDVLASLTDAVWGRATRSDQGLPTSSNLARWAAVRLMNHGVDGLVQPAETVLLRRLARMNQSTSPKRELMGRDQLSVAMALRELLKLRQKGR